MAASIFVSSISSFSMSIPSRVLSLFEEINVIILFTLFCNPLALLQNHQSLRPLFLINAVFFI